MMTTEEAAERLGVSRRRVRELIRVGDLAADKFGRQWMVDSESVERRAATPRLSGRPLKGERDMRNLKEFTLCCKNHPVFDIVYNVSTSEIVKIGTSYDLSYAPMGATNESGPVLENLKGWFARRSIPDGRANIDATLRKLGLKQPGDLVFGSLGLNLSDQYWFRPKGTEIDWHDVNFFENDYVDNMGLYIADQIDDVDGGSQASPSPATAGVLSKWWVKRDGVSWLIKGGAGSDNREPYNEVLSSKLYSLFLDDDEFVDYHIESIGGRDYSACKGFVDSGTELVTMWDVMAHGAPRAMRHDYSTYVRLCESMGIEDARAKLSRMIVLDFLIGNCDRHEMNLGVMLDAEDRTALGIAPIFDSGMSFYYSEKRPWALEAALHNYEAAPFDESPMRQLLLASDYAWLDPDRLVGFDDVIRETLIENPFLSEEFVEATACQFAMRANRVYEIAAETHPRFAFATFDRGSASARTIAGMAMDAKAAVASTEATAAVSRSDRRGAR